MNWKIPPDGALRLPTGNSPLCIRGAVMGFLNSA